MKTVIQRWKKSERDNVVRNAPKTRQFNHTKPLLTSLDLPLFPGLALLHQDPDLVAQLAHLHLQKIGGKRSKVSNFVQIAQISKTDLNVLQLPVPLLPGDHLRLGLLRRRGRGGHRAGHAGVVQKMRLLLPLRRRMLLLGSSSRSLRHFGSLKKKKKERHKCQKYLRRAKEKHKLQYFEGLVNCIKYLFPLPKSSGDFCTLPNLTGATERRRAGESTHRNAQVTNEFTASQSPRGKT